MGAASTENCRYLKKIKNGPTIQSSSSPYGYLSEENENTNSERYLHSLSSRQHYLEQPRYRSNLSARGQLSGYKDVVYTHSGILKVKVAQSCLTRCNPMDYTVHGILQTRILEWVVIPFSPGDLPNPGIEPRSPTLQADSLPAEPPGELIRKWNITRPFKKMKPCHL